MVPEIHWHVAPNLVSVAKAPEGKAFLRVECLLTVKLSDEELDLAPPELVVAGKKLKPAAKMQANRTRVSFVNYQHYNPRQRSESTVYLFIVPDTFRSGTLSWGPFNKPVSVKGPSKLPSVLEDYDIKVVSAKYVKPQRAWTDHNEDQKVGAPLTGAVFEVTISAKQKSSPLLSNAVAFFAREFSLLLPSRDLVVCLGTRSTLGFDDTDEDPDDIPRIGLEKPRASHLLFAVPKGTTSGMLFLRGEPIGRVTVGGAR